jgi:cytochrome d ubiquinol oxidase subunit II
MMTLNDVWFILFVVVISGYLILDGFDMGVGILHLIVARTDEERRISLNTIGPVWDGNEVWIILGGGALFAAFPLVYASLFSGFYAAMMLVLLVMILRTCAIEFRSKRPSPAWRTTWDAIFSVASLLLALLLGVAFGNIIRGVPIDASGNMHVTLIELLNPFSLLVGVTSVAMLAMHGGFYLEIKTEAAIKQRAHSLLPVLLLVYTALIALVVVATFLFERYLLTNYRNNIWPVIFPLAAFVAVVMSWVLSRAGRYLQAFVASSGVIALSVITAATGLYPNLLISTTNHAFNLTVYNGASASNTLGVMLVIAILGLPLALLYTAVVYTLFRGKTRLDTRSY